MPTSDSDYSNIFSDAESDFADTTSTSSASTESSTVSSSSHPSSHRNTNERHTNIDLPADLRRVDALQQLPNLLQRKLVRLVSTFPNTSPLHTSPLRIRMTSLRSIVKSVSTLGDATMSYEDFMSLEQRLRRRPSFGRLGSHRKQEFMLLVVVLMFELSKEQIIGMLDSLICKFNQNMELTARCTRCELFLADDFNQCRYCKQMSHTGCLVNGTCFKCLTCSVCRSSTSDSPSTICKRCGKIVHVICFPACHLCNVCVSRAPVLGSPYCNACLNAQACAHCRTPVRRGSRCICSALLCDACTQGPCIRCGLLPQERLPDTSLRFLGSMSECHFCGSRIFPSFPTTFCCAKGKHILPPEHVLIPDIIADFIVSNRTLLNNSSREINQLCSLAAIGVRSQSSPMGWAGCNKTTSNLLRLLTVGCITLTFSTLARGHTH